MKDIFENLVIKYYNFIIKMNRVLKFNHLIQYRKTKYMNLGVDMVGAAKL